MANGVCAFRSVPASQLVSAKLRVPSFHLDFGPSFDGVTIKDNFADIKGKRSFGTRFVTRESEQIDASGFPDGTRHA
jgi:hypothetical protein